MPRINEPLTVLISVGEPDGMPEVLSSGWRTITPSFRAYHSAPSGPNVTTVGPFTGIELVRVNSDPPPPPPPPVVKLLWNRLNGQPAPPQPASVSSFLFVLTE